ncbi:hypothetical protein [Stratiformator vulcanicus]|uniref:Flagellar basal body P-ring biosynthesis protein FlgA n=1 Tax=Stratiformator vulcanicus TaxID=2527980 RepID=A0A517R2U5_9PLAN|nr:hypothetical protein [Stratiformator vulcanicus]QDT38207.1 hypothetical protein Pan189_25970 [Stratiformator vulcanicus]
MRSITIAAFGILGLVNSVAVAGEDFSNTDLVELQDRLDDLNRFNDNVLLKDKKVDEIVERLSEQAAGKTIHIRLRVERVVKGYVYAEALTEVASKCLPAVLMLPTESYERHKSSICRQPGNPLMAASAQVSGNTRAYLREIPERWSSTNYYRLEPSLRAGRLFNFRIRSAVGPELAETLRRGDIVLAKAKIQSVCRARLDPQVKPGEVDPDFETKLWARADTIMFICVDPKVSLAERTDTK